MNTEKNIAKSINKGINTNKRKKKKTNSVGMLIIGIVLGIILGALVTFIVLDTNKGELNTTGNEEEQQEEVTSTVDEMLKEEASTITTPFCDLYYPEKWKDSIRIEQIEGDVHTVQFFGTVDGKEEVHVFDIAFGKTEGLLLGTIDETEIYLIYSEIEFDESWSEEEQNVIYTMQEDVNYIIGMLEEEEKFIPSY